MAVAAGRDLSGRSWGRDDGVDLLDLLVAQGPVGGLGVGPDLLGLGRTGDNRCYGWFGGQPRDGQLEDGMAAIGRETLQCLDYIEPAIGQQFPLPFGPVPAIRVPGRAARRGGTSRIAVRT